MADISVKMGVTGIAQFKQGMTQAQASVKSLDAALKLNEKQYKATGDAENYMQQKTTLLQQKLEAQKTAAKNAEQALKSLQKSGVDETSTAYQNMQRKLLEAQAAMMDTESEIQQLGSKTAETAGKADKLSQSLGGLNKKVSLEQVRGAVSSITSGLEAGAKKAEELGKKLWDMIMDSARRADDTATMAEMYGIDLQRFKQMQALVGSGLDTSVEAVLTAQDKMKKGIGNGTDAVMEQLRALGLLQEVGTKYAKVEMIPKDMDQLFWDAGKAILAMTDATKQEAAAQALFGRNWKELKPLFDSYDSLEDYNKALDSTEVSSEDATRNLAELNDAVSQLETTWTSLKDEVVGAIAPALTGAADALSGLLGNVLEYLKTPEGQKALEDMGKAVEGLFSSLSEIDPQQVVEGFSGVFNGIIEGLQWLDKSKGTIVEAMKFIVGGWAALKLTGGILDIAKLISGISGLAGGASAAAEAGAAAGASWGGSFASAVLAAAPWLAGLITLLTPAGSASNNTDVMFDPTTGKMTQAGWESWLNNPQGWADSLMKVGEIFGDLGRITLDPNALNEIGKWATGNGTLEGMIQALEALGYVKQAAEELNTETGGEAGIEWDKSQPGEKRTHRNQGKLPTEVEPELPDDAQEKLQSELDGLPVETKVEPGLPEDAQAILQEQLNQLMLSAVIRINPQLAGLGIGSIPGRANGLPFVPFDGYPAILHKGERVIPAREVNNSRSFSSNLYVESMIMNNGTDAEGLAAAMAAAQRRAANGFGN